MQPENKIEQTAAPTQDKSEEIKPAVQATEQPAAETPEQINWKKFREQREIERKQKEAAEKLARDKEAEANALKAAMDAILNKPVTHSLNDKIIDNYEDISDEERIERKVAEALSKREQEYEQQRKQREIAELPINLQKTFGDFNQVCSTENLDYLEFHYPEVASAYKYMPDGFDKWSNIYKAVKKFVPNTDSRKDVAKADKNFMKPQSPSSPGLTQTGQPQGGYNLSEARKAENYARMQRIMKGVN